MTDPTRPSAAERRARPVAGGQTMAERYGVPSPRRIRVGVALVAVVVSALLAWLLWTAWVHATPAVSGRLASYDVVSAHRVEVSIAVSRSGTAAVECTVTAQAEDHTVVGEDVVEISAGASDEVTVAASIRTDREATSASVRNCH